MWTPAGEGERREALPQVVSPGGGVRQAHVGGAVDGQGGFVVGVEGERNRVVRRIIGEGGAELDAEVRQERRQVYGLVVEDRRRKEGGDVRLDHHAQADVPPVEEDVHAGAGVEDRLLQARYRNARLPVCPARR